MIHVYPNPADAAIGVIDTNVDTLITNVAAIKADTDAYLDASVSTRASQTSVDTIDTNVDTIVTNVAAIKADTDAYLDVAVSSVAFPAQTDINRANGLVTISTSVDGFAIEAANLSVSPGNSYTEVISINVPGILWWASCHRGGGFSAGTLNIRITIDGVVALLSDQSSTVTTSGVGVVGVGYFSNSTAILMPIRFSTSLKIEVTSSVSQSSAIDAHYLYTVG